MKKRVEPKEWHFVWHGQISRASIIQVGVLILMLSGVILSARFCTKDMATQDEPVEQAILNESTQDGSMGRAGLDETTQDKVDATDISMFNEPFVQRDNWQNVTLDEMELPDDAELLFLKTETTLDCLVSDGPMQNFRREDLKRVYRYTLQLIGVIPQTGTQRQLAEFCISSNTCDPDTRRDFYYATSRYPIYANHREWFSRDLTKFAVTKVYPSEDSEETSTRVGWLTQEGEFCDVTSYLDFARNIKDGNLVTLGFVTSRLWYNEYYSVPAEIFCVLTCEDGELYLHCVPMSELSEALQYHNVVNTEQALATCELQSGGLQMLLNGNTVITPASETITEGGQSLIIAEDSYGGFVLSPMAVSKGYYNVSLIFEPDDTLTLWDGVITADGQYVAFAAMDSDLFTELRKAAEETEKAEGTEEIDEAEKTENSDAKDIDPSMKPEGSGLAAEKSHYIKLYLVDALKCKGTQLEVELDLTEPATKTELYDDFCILCGWYEPEISTLAK